MNNEISRLRDQLRRGLALFSFNRLCLELTDGEPRQCLLEVLVKKSEDEITSASRQDGGGFSPPLGQNQHIVVEAYVCSTSFK